jgi:hypothetical protein
VSRVDARKRRESTACDERKRCMNEESRQSPSVAELVALRAFDRRFGCLLYRVCIAVYQRCTCV